MRLPVFLLLALARIALACWLLGRCLMLADAQAQQLCPFVFQRAWTDHSSTATPRLALAPQRLCIAAQRWARRCLLATHSSACGRLPAVRLLTALVRICAAAPMQATGRGRSGPARRAHPTGAARGASLHCMRTVQGR